MKKLLLAVTLVCVATTSRAAQHRVLAVEEYLDKVKGGWAGQMIGVSYGAPTEFKARGSTYDEPLVWKPERINNSLGQDDVYVDLSFLEALEKYGLDVTWEEAGKAFAETKFQLWHANKAGRDNCRAGIMPPASGSPEHNGHYNDIDFQIESDFCGLISPGLPRSSNALCNVFGRVMNSDDGLYGGVFMAAMYTEAFFEKDPHKLVRYGLRAIPRDSVYAKTIRDVITWHYVYPDDWRKTWQRVQDKWASHPSGKCSSDPKGFNIDASLNGAYVVMGLLYGDGDLLKTMEISTRCGQDSDCNPANAAGILCTAMGYDAIPDEFKSGIPAISGRKFAEVKYTFNDIAPVCLRFARENVLRAGGRVETRDGKEVFLIPVQTVEVMR